MNVLVIQLKKEKPLIIDNYYGNNVNFDKIKKEKKEKDKLDYYCEICIERRKHICDSKIESIKDNADSPYGVFLLRELRLYNARNTILNEISHLNLDITKSKSEYIVDVF